MGRVSKYQWPSLALILIGLYIAVRSSLSFAHYIMDLPSHRLGLLREFSFLLFLLFSGVLIVIAIRGFRRERPALPLAVLVGVGTLWGTFLVDLYSRSMSTQFSVLLGIIISVLPVVGVYLIVRE